MLSLFPELLFLAPLSALLIRASIAVLFALGAYDRFRGSSSAVWYVLAILEALAALSLSLGYWAQAGALLALALIALSLVLPTLRRYPISTLLLLFVMCLSILVTGPGAFAFDLPL